MIDTAILRVPSQNLASMMVTGIGAVLLFASYCQVHSWFDAATVPAYLSVQWGLAMGVPSAVAIHLLSHYARELSEFAWRSPLAMLGLWFGLTLAGVSFGATIQFVIGRPDWQDFIGSLIEHMHDLLPEVAALAAFVTCLLLLHRTISQPTQNPASEWISFPEAPALHLRVADIRYIHSAGNYCEIHVNGRSHLVRMTMAQADQRLKQHGFARIHRTLVVNMARIVEIDRSPRHRAGVVHIDTGDRLPLGNVYAVDVIDRLKMIGKSSGR